jgi:hypothetical protein
MKTPMTPKFTRHDCRDIKGNLLFYIEVAEYYFLNYIIWTSIPISILIDKDVLLYMRIIEERVVKDDLREHFIKKLFDAIKKMPGIEEYYCK